MARGSTMTGRCRFVAREVTESAEGNGYWIALAQPTPWPDENNPPVYHNNLLEIPRLIGMTYVYECRAVTQDPFGNVSMPTASYSVVPDLNVQVLAISKANHIWYEAYVPKETLELHTAQYRCIAICKNIQFQSTPEKIPAEFIPVDQIVSYETDWLATINAVNVADIDNHLFRIVRTV